MKTISPLLLLPLFLAAQACWGSNQVNRLPPQLLKFTAGKEEQVKQTARDLNLKVPIEVSGFFEAAQRGDCAEVTNIIARLALQLEASRGKPAPGEPAWSPFWQPMIEVEGACAAFATGGTKYPLAFANGIIEGGTKALPEST